MVPTVSLWPLRWRLASPYRGKSEDFHLETCFRRFLSLDQLPGFEPGPPSSTPGTLPLHYSRKWIVLQESNLLLPTQSGLCIHTLSTKLVEDIGIEPMTQPCKGRVFPAIPIPQKFFGAGCRSRTDDLPLTRRLLYQLS